MTYSLKILILGETGVGKSSILSRFSNDTFTQSHSMTIGIDFKIKTININDVLYKLQIWDTAGQERFRSITRSYYAHSMGIVLVYDVCDIDTFNNIRYWILDIQEKIDHPIIKILVANKCDEIVHRQISANMGQDLADEFNMKYFETSAKSNLNINNIFHVLTNEIINNLDINPDKSDFIDISFNNIKSCCRH